MPAVSRLPNSAFWSVRPARKSWPALAALALAAALPACGGPRKSASADRPAPAPPADFSGALPQDAPLTATFEPAALTALIGALGERNVPLRSAFARSDAGFLLDPEFLPAFGVDAARPAWFSVRSGPVSAVLQTSEDLVRVFQAPEQFARWVAENPPPPAWVHVRLLAHRAAGREVSPADWLGLRYGAVQMLAPVDAPEMWAAALDTSPARAQAVQTALAGLGAYRLVVLLETNRPTALVLVETPTQVSVDWVADAGFGAGGLTAGLIALTAPPAATENPGTERVAGAPAKGEALRLHVVHGPWIRWSRAMAEIEVVTEALADAQTPIEVRGARLAQARRAAALPEQLLGPGALLFRASRLSVRATPSDVLVQVEASYTSRAARLGALGDGQAPVAARSLSGAGAATVTVAATPRHGRTFDELAPLPALPLDRFVAETLHCGFVCWPALWAGLPGYARQPVAALGTIFPEVAGFAEPLAGATGAAFIVQTQPKPGFGLAARYGKSLAEPQARWRAALPALEQRAVATGAEPVLLVGNAPQALDTLARSVGGAAVPTAALVDAEFQGPISSIFGRFGVRITLGREAMQVESRLALLPLAPPEDADDADAAPAGPSR